MRRAVVCCFAQWAVTVVVHCAEADSIAVTPQYLDVEILEAVAGVPTDATATFHLLNHGKHVVNIKRIEASCKCIKVESTAKAIMPGEETKVTAELRIGTDEPAASASVVVMFDDDSTKQIKISASVDRKVVVSPGRVYRAQPGEKIVRIARYYKKLPPAGEISLHCQTESKCLKLNLSQPKIPDTVSDLTGLFAVTWDLGISSDQAATDLAVAEIVCSDAHAIVARIPVFPASDPMAQKSIFVNTVVAAKDVNVSFDLEADCHPVRVIAKEGDAPHWDVAAIPGKKVLNLSFHSPAEPGFFRKEFEVFWDDSRKAVFAVSGLVKRE